MKWPHASGEDSHCEGTALCPEGDSLEDLLRVKATRFRHQIREAHFWLSVLVEGQLP